MIDSAVMQDVIERAVSDVLEAALPDLRARLAARLHQELATLAPSPAAETAAPPNPSDLLFAAQTSIEDAASQSEILGALLAGTQSFCGRSALLVVKRDSVRVWRARGFDGDVLRDLTVDAAQPLLARAIETREPAAAAAADMGSEFVAAAGNPADGNATLLPLVVNQKVVALLYADGGADARLDASALQILARSTAVWIELVGLRKSGAAAEPTAVEEPPQEAPAPQAAAAIEEAEVEAEAVAPSPEPQYPAEPHPPTAEPQEEAPVAMAAAAAADLPAPSAYSSDLHRRALRFAKLLVDEIRLYNKDKVEQGRQSKDLYDRLREDIEKSRATYEKRFGQSEAASADYFNQELVRILAGNDPSLLGGSFRP